ncbi:hypothetical protein PV392_29475 [Streptomyces sp. ME03-5709C]|nr:hypothetical protein [Streptomyces sp. ME03-5709C]
MADLVLAGVLGAAVLAIVLLYRGYQRNRALITQLRAELAAQKIAAMSHQHSPRHAVPPDPARRKGHLSLYMGGGVLAAVFSFGGRIREVWRAHRVVTAAVTTVAAAGTAAAITFTGGTAPAPGDVPPPAPRNTAPLPPPEPQSDTVADEEPARERPAVQDSLRDPEKPSVLPMSAGERETPAPAPSPTVTARATPPVAAPPPTTPLASPPAISSRPTPSASATRRPGRCLDLRPLVGACILKEKTPR